MRVSHARTALCFALAIGSIAYVVSSCGVEEGGPANLSSEKTITGDIRSGTGGDSPFAVSFLEDNEILSTACRGVFAVEQDRTADDSLLFKYKFEVGDAIILRDATLGFGIVRGHYSNAFEYGTATVSIDETLLTVDCPGYVSTVVALSDITLYSDATYATEICTITEGTVVKNAGAFDRIVDTNNVTGTYLASVEFDVAVGDCPAETQLHFQREQEFVDLGPEFGRYDLLTPIIQVFMPPDG